MCVCSIPIITKKVKNNVGMILNSLHNWQVIMIVCNLNGTWDSFGGGPSLIIMGESN
jgi:hypothetical protein